MFTFENRTGPADLAASVTYPPARVPQWYRDAKLGFFIHLGLYSVPAWAYRPGGPFDDAPSSNPPVPPTRASTTAAEVKGADAVPGESALSDAELWAYTHHRYAEWYANTYRLPSPCRRYHDATFPRRTYESFAADFRPTAPHLTHLVQQLVDAGGRYIVPTTKHHDGFCLWDTATTSFNSLAHAGIDVVDAIVTATRTAGAQVGLYFSGALDWHVSDFPPIASDADVFALRRNDADFAAYSARQLRELIDRFTPALLWNDIDWPDSGKSATPDSLATLLTDFYARQPEGVVNDRWGVPHHGFLTREYMDVPAPLTEPWEATRGLARSFGYNANESPADRLTAPAVAALLVDVVSKGGNLLLNVGPRADGSLDPYQSDVLARLGEWMRGPGALLYGSRPAPEHTWRSPGGVRAITRDDSRETVIFLREAADVITLPPWLRPRRTRWGHEGAQWVGFSDDAATRAGISTPTRPTTQPAPTTLPVPATLKVPAPIRRQLETSAFPAALRVR